MCVDFTKVDPSKDSKENMLVLTDAFTKFSQAFSNTQPEGMITIVKILVDKQFYVYGIPACMHRDKWQSFDNEIMTHLYAMYGIEQSTTMPYSLCGNAPTERVEPYINWPAQVTTEGAEEYLTITSTITGIWHIMPCHTILPVTSCMRWFLGANHQLFVMYHSELANYND